MVWLISLTVMVFLIIIIGGLTRLTNSGLSITKWELFEGILPPLNDNAWKIYFEKYKQIPQYKLLNFDMTLDEFKIIFFWEYFHRIFARLIGLFFLIPLIYFYFSKKIKKEYMNTNNSVFVSHQDTIRSFTFYELDDKNFNENKPDHCSVHEIIKNKLIIHTYLD